MKIWRTFKKQKGSMPVVLILALTSALTVLMLGNLLIAENANNKKHSMRFEHVLYQTKNTLETTMNLVFQKLNENELKFQNQTFYALSASELTEMETALNTSVLPYLSPGTTVDITNLKFNKSLDMLCDEVVGQNPYTLEEEVTGISCASSYFYMSFDIQITTTNGDRKINVKLNNLYPVESNRTGFIKINYDNVKIDYSGL